MPGVGIGVIVLNDKNEVLLLHRNNDNNIAKSDMHLEGTWTLPSGKVKLNEKIIDAATRKCLEEAGINVLGLSIICINDDINEFAHFVTIGLIANSYTSDIKISSEFTEYKFFNLNELPDDLCFPSKKIINAYLTK